MIQINLLPWREQERKLKQKRFGIIVAIAAGMGLFVTVFFHMHYAAKTSHQIKRNILLQAALDQESLELATLNDQKKELIIVDDKLHFMFDLRESSYRAVRMLNELTIANPEGVTLYKIVRTGNTIVVLGKAKSNQQVTLFMERIEKSKFFTQPVLTEISGKEGHAGEERIFQLKIEQQG